jgi:hypothetical protein
MNIVPRLIFVSLSLGTVLFAGAAESDKRIGAELHPPFINTSSPLVEKVRRATRRYRDVNVAIAEGWAPGTPCVSGPNEGAMGVHFVLPARIGDGPLPGGAMRLVGVEFIVIAADWTKKNPNGPAPAVDGHLTHFVGEPNRYGLPAFHELHVWAWEQNPKGYFADWNTLVSCNRQAE